MCQLVAALEIIDDTYGITILMPIVGIVRDN